MRRLAVVLLAVLAAGASLVQVVNPDESALDRRADTERCSASQPITAWWIEVKIGFREIIAIL